jgi:alkaline phosphatase
MAGYALLETQEFNHAVAAALTRVNLADTLIIVTADHSHALSISGYPTRGNPILDLVRGNDASGNPEGSPTLADDGVPYTTLGYMSGPGAVSGTEPRPIPDVGMNSQYQALFSPIKKPIYGSEYIEAAHSGEDVAAFAVGPWAHLVSGVLDQPSIYYIMTYAYGWSR